MSIIIGMLIWLRDSSHVKFCETYLKNSKAVCEACKFVTASKIFFGASGSWQIK